MNKQKWLTYGGWSVYLLWHLVFVIVALALFLPYLALPMINSAQMDSAPWSYAIYISLLVALPFISLLVVWLRFRSNVLAALQLFYAVELPLMLLLLLRVTMLRDAPPASLFVFANIAIAIAAYFWMLWRDFKSASGKKLNLVFAFSTVVALVGLYLGLLLGVYFLPYLSLALEAVFSGLVQINWADLGTFVDRLFSNLLFAPLVILLAMTVLFVFTTPLVLIVAYIHQFIICYKHMRGSHVLAVMLSLLLIEALMFSTSHTQPQGQAFELTQELPVDTDSRRQLLEESEFIKQGLLNAYLATYRYVSTTGNSRSLERVYAKIFGESSSIASAAQWLFNSLAAPFLYQGDDFAGDRQLAAQRYQEFFDSPIDKAEKDVIFATIKSTWQNEQNQAGLMNAASHHVLLTDQSIAVEEHNDMAMVTITQTLVNQTFQPQEVVIHFSLPEDAVVTGLWMSDELGNPEKFKHVVAPRGAAQSVYKAEVERRIDPALLEKVGPLQYRLRAFPIPARIVKRRGGGNRYSEAFRDFDVSAATVRFQYAVRVDELGRWPLPRLLEKRNIYWDKQTKRSHSVASIANWLPLSLNASWHGEPKDHSVFIDGVTIRAVPQSDDLVGKINPSDLVNPVAIIIDGSYSMGQVKHRLSQQLRWLNDSGVSYRLFFCQINCLAIAAQELEQQVFFGNSQLVQHLSQWQKLHHRQYAAVFVLTDAGSYELSPEQDKTVAMPAQPVWLVHLGAQIPYAYDDAVIDTVLESHGGIADKLSAAMDQLLSRQLLGLRLKAGELIGVGGEYLWYLSEDRAAETTASSGPFLALAADRWINHLAAKGDKTELTTLDRIHSIAKTNDIVSFYSSMLVLVEERQRQLLKAAEQREDRFAREVETGAESLSTPIDPFTVPGVPEPEEWALLLVVLTLLCIAYVRKRRLTSNTFLGGGYS